jgi:hypothetical protein
LAGAILKSFSPTNQQPEVSKVFNRISFAMLLSPRRNRLGYAPA